jgi:magnesium transporter
MIQTRNYNNLVWVDVESPTREEVSGLVRTHGLHPLVGEGLLNATSKPRIEYHEGYIYLVLHIPLRTKMDDKHVVVEKEIDFVIGKEFIITTKYDTIEPLHNFSKVFETDSIIDKESIGEHAGFIFYYMMKKLYAHMANDLENMKDALMLAEANVFAGNEKDMVFVLSNLSRELIDLKQIGRLHKDVLDSMAPIVHEFFGEDFHFYMNDLLKEYEKVHELSGNNRELVNELRETNDSLLTTKQNEIMKILTVLASIIFPLTLIESLFSSQVQNMTMLLVTLVVVTIAMTAFFKYKKWL